jgi:hypothetical protein
MNRAIDGKIVINANITSAISEQIETSKKYSKTSANPPLLAFGSSFLIRNWLFAAARAGRSSYPYS